MILFSTIIYSSFIILLLNRARVNLVCFITVNFFFIISWLCLLFLFLFTFWIFVIFVFGSLFVIILDNRLINRVFLFLSKLFKLRAIEVVLNKQEATVLDLFGSLNCRRLCLSVFLDFGLRLEGLAPFWSGGIILRCLLLYFLCIYRVRTHLLITSHLVHLHGTRHGHSWIVSHLRWHLSLHHGLMRLTIVYN